MSNRCKDGAQLQAELRTKRRNQVSEAEAKKVYNQVVTETLPDPIDIWTLAALERLKQEGLLNCDAEQNWTVVSKENPFSGLAR